MRTIERTSAFKHDYKREKKGRRRKTLDALVAGVVKALANDVPLPVSNQDYPLTVDWNDHRDCHLKPDLVLIYRKLDADTLQLVRLGSHSELFG